MSDTARHRFAIETSSLLKIEGHAFQPDMVPVDVQKESVRVTRVSSEKLTHSCPLPCWRGSLNLQY
ncbi:MAG: hypothetical protein R3C01_01200 [Planctomycetaceae bacterium]